MALPGPPAPPSPRRGRLRTAVLVGLALLLVVAVLAVPSLPDGNGDGGSGSSTSRPAARRPLPGFGEVTLRVLEVAAGSELSPAEHCSLLADTPAQQARGLMTRRDLGGYASMVFRYGQDVTSRFYNRNVPIALSVAWFDGDGRWLGSNDLEPCPDMEGCPTIAPPAPFRYVVEVPRGGLARLGLGPGSRIAVAAGC